MVQFSYLVAVGSNLGERRHAIDTAISLIAERGLHIEQTSEMVETDPIGAADQVFLNGAFTCVGSIYPDDFMRLLLEVENQIGRVRDVRWGNRCIDLDVLLIKDEHGVSIDSRSSILTVPHPRMLERDFMLRPASAVAGHWLLPFSDQNLRSLCLSRGWSPTWNNLRGEIKLLQTLRGDIFSAATSRLWWPIIFFMLVFRLWIAAHVPFGNDEAYYWDWGRAPQLSYFDHPPMVSWLALVSRLFVFNWANGPLQGRFIVPWLHLASTCLFGAVVARLSRRVLTTNESRAVLVLTQAVPAFSLGGMMLMPDAGLIFFSTFALWVLLAVVRREHLSWKVGLLTGLMFGGAGLSKYHAAIIACGVLAEFAWLRRKSWSRDRVFWLWLIGAGLFAILPVLIWNANHHWASFIFQGSRGWSGHDVDLRNLGRTMIGVVLFLGPALIAGRINFAWSDARLVLTAGLPLLGILLLFSITSQILPHWTMPSFWLLSVLVVPSLASSRAVNWSAIVYGGIVCIAVPLILSFQESRRAILKLTGDRPGGLGELTLWDTAVRDERFLNYVMDPAWISESMAHEQTYKACPRGLIMAAPRWFTVAQLAANLPHHPTVETIDRDHLSYYHFRTRAPLKGCPVVVVGELSHFDADGWSGMIHIFELKKFEIDGHRDRMVFVVRGEFVHDSKQFGAGEQIEN